MSPGRFSEPWSGHHRGGWKLKSGHLVGKRLSNHCASFLLSLYKMNGEITPELCNEGYNRKEKTERMILKMSLCSSLTNPEKCLYDSVCDLTDIICSVILNLLQAIRWDTAGRRKTGGPCETVQRTLLRGAELVGIRSFDKVE